MGINHAIKKVFFTNQHSVIKGVVKLLASVSIQYN
ncbi:MAG: hypothetical protein ACI9YP_000491 [Colwellia sp.]|jgi:hypothetical protein